MVINPGGAQPVKSPFTSQVKAQTSTCRRCITHPVRPNTLRTQSTFQICCCWLNHIFTHLHISLLHVCVTGSQLEAFPLSTCIYSAKPCVTLQWDHKYQAVEMPKVFQTTEIDKIGITANPVCVYVHTLVWVCAWVFTNLPHTQQSKRCAWHALGLQKSPCPRLTLSWGKKTFKKKKIKTWVRIGNVSKAIKWLWLT